MMNVLYNSPTYVVVEYSDQDGIELVDKAAGRGAFFEGLIARKFRSHIQHVFDDNPSVESVDEFLGNYDALLTNAVTYH
jgi:hypothetical protein